MPPSLTTEGDPLRQRAADLGIHTLPIPTPFAVGKVNCYLIEDDPLTLVDTGPNMGTSLVVLEELLRSHGHEIADLERIVLTHQHIDHVGLVRHLAEKSGAEVCAWRPLGPWLERYGVEMEADDQFAEQLMHQSGVPADLTMALRAVTAMARSWGQRGTVHRPLDPGDELTFASGRTWTVLHRPGHSPSDTVFHDAERGTLVAGDHLLSHISSNPLISRPLDGPVDGRPHALQSYRRSLQQTHEMELELVLGGHGDPVDHHRSLIEERFRQNDRRARKIDGMLREADGPRTAFELAQQMWGAIALQQTYLTLSEVLGHLDLLVADGRSVEQEPDDDGVVRFGPT